MMIFWIALMGSAQATIGRVAPGWNLPLLEVVVLYYGLSASRGAAVFAAAAAAVARDALSQAPLGAGLLPMILVALLAEAVRDHVFRTSAVTWIVCGLAAGSVSMAVQFVMAATVLGRPAAVMTVHTLFDMLTVPLAGAVCAPVVLSLVEGGNRILGVVSTGSEG